MGVYKYLKEMWQKPQTNKRIVAWRKEPVTVRLEHPTRLDRARALGYKAKQGFFIVRQRVNRGPHVRSKPAGGRRSRNTGRIMNLNLNYQAIAERRASQKYVNCEVLNSYFVAKDGTQAWYEVILVDPSHPIIKKDMPWISQTRGRAERGLTSANRKSRGLRKKGIGAEKVRPSLRANKGRLH